LRLTAFSGATMGTTDGVKIADAPAGLDADRMGASIVASLGAIDARMSTYRPASELSLFNAAVTTDWVPVSAPTRAVIATALGVSRLTGGAFDPTIGPLVDLWGFGPGPGRTHPPTGGEIAATLGRMGHWRVTTRGGAPAVRGSVAGLGIDLSGIAKGFAVDEMAALLESAGVSQFLVEIGGELRGRGLSPRGAPWRVGVERPDRGRGAVRRVVRLDSGALATSGDYRNFFEEGGRCFSHIIDPRTGRPVAHGLASVTVIAGTTMRADALSTALMVMGPEQGMALAKREGIAAFFLSHQGGHLAETMTESLRRRVVP
jgi:thiamine biosynthesis lipoprotein